MDAQGFIWHELMSRDPEASEEFYETVTGVAVQRVADAPGDYRLLLVDGRPIAGMTGPRTGSTTWPSGGPEGHWVPYFGTDDVEAAVGRAKAGGGTVLGRAGGHPRLGPGSGAPRSGRSSLRGLPTRMT
jgi:predicted enzyme related to lactoylglutathione lyase